MAITFVAFSEGTPTSSLSNTSTVSKPSGLAVGDVMVAYVVANQAGISQPSGSTWTRILSQDASTGNLFRAEVWYRVATSSDVAASSYAWRDGDNSSPMWAAIVAYRGVDTANPIDDSDSAASSTKNAHTTPSLSTAHSSMILYHRAVRTSSGTTNFSSSIAHERIEGSNHSTVGYSAVTYDAGTEDPAGSISGASISAGTTTNITDSIVTTVALKTLNVAVSVNAGVASVTASGKSPSLDLEVSLGPDSISADIDAKSPIAGIGGAAGSATASASVKQVDIFTTPFSNAPAGCAQVTASAKQTQMDYAPAGRASATALAGDVSESIGNRADVARVTSTAHAPSLGFGVSAGLAQVAGAGKNISVALGLPADVAQAIVDAYLGVLYFGSSRTIDVGEEVRTMDVAWEERTLMAEES